MMFMEDPIEQWFSACGCYPSGDKRPFHRGCLRPLENMDIYITIHNSGKITASEVAMKIILLLGSPQHEELLGIRK